MSRSQPLAILGLLLLAGCQPAPPPYGVLTYDHSHHETLDASGKVVARDCATHVQGGVETTGAALQGQSCGDTIGGTTAGVQAFTGQAIGAPIYMAQVQAAAARDQALVAGGVQAGQIGICAALVAATVGTAGGLGPAALAPCLKALTGSGVAPTPTPEPAPAPFAPPRRPASAGSPQASADPWAPGWHQGVTGTRRLLVAADAGRVAYITPAGHSYDSSTAAWLRWLGVEASS